MVHKKFELCSWIEESHKKPIYCVTFNHLCSEHGDVFAASGSNKASVYRCKPDGSFELLQAYVDADEKECFFVCKWSYLEDNGAPLLLLAGNKGIVRALNLNTQELHHSFRGHGNSINDIAIHPLRPQLFVTASKDNAVRVWNLRSRSCVLTSSGDTSHTSEVLSLDFHPWDMDTFVSSGMDNSVKIWSLKTTSRHIELSDAWTPDSAAPLPTKDLVHPVFSSKQVHANYVDCVRWLGDLMLSKSVDNRILLWRPVLFGPDRASLETSSSYVVLQSFSLQEADIWFLRFSLDLFCTTLVCGNRTGRVFVFDPHKRSMSARQKLGHPNCKKPVRQVAISADGRIVIASCEDATIWRWDQRVPLPEAEEEEEEV